MKPVIKRKRLRLSLLGLACMMLFLGSQDEGCGSCSGFFDDKLELDLGTIRIINTLDNILYKEQSLVISKISGTLPHEQYFYKLTDFPRKIEKNVSAGKYQYIWDAVPETGKKIIGHGYLNVTAGNTIVLTLKAK